MFYTWKEFCRWLNVTLFEFWMFLLATICFTFLLALKIENPFNILEIIDIKSSSLNWWHIFFPYFLNDALASYFNIIIFIRQYHIGKIRQAFIRLVFVTARLAMLCVVKVFLIYKFENRLAVNFSEIFLPLFFLLFILICRSFRI